MCTYSCSLTELELLYLYLKGRTELVMSFFRSRFGGGGGKEDRATTTTVVEANEINDGNLTYVAEQGGNNALPSYQEALGAPVESQSPFGYAVGPVTIIFLNISKMIGTGVYSTRKETLRNSWSMQVLIGECSVVYLSGNRFGWTEFDLLVHRLPHLAVIARGVLGVCIVFPQSLWVRSRILGTSLPAAEIFLPDRICGTVCNIVVQQR